MINPYSYDLVCPIGHRTHCRCEWVEREKAITIATRLITITGLMCRFCEEPIERAEEVPQA